MTSPSSRSRRTVLRAGLTTLSSLPFLRAAGSSDPWLKISLQQYSFNRALRSGKLEPLAYPGFAVEKTGIKALIEKKLAQLS